MVATTASFSAVSKKRARPPAMAAGDLNVKVDTAYYLANIGKVTSIPDFVNNCRLFSYAMKAYGLEDMDYAKGLMSQALEGGIADQSSLANTMNDPRVKDFVTAFDGIGKGAAAQRSTAADTVSKYLQRSVSETAAARPAGQTFQAGGA